MFSLLRFDSLRLPSLRIRNATSAGEQIRTLFGIPVLWLPYEQGGHHLPEAQLEPYRQVGDPLVDHLLDMLALEGRPLGSGDDLLQLAEQAEQDPEAFSPLLQEQLVSFIQHCRTVPPWVDVEQLRRGQDVFLAYAAAMGASLYYRSLVAGFSIPKLAAVIQSTGYLAPPSSREQVRSRLLDTGALMGACMEGGAPSLLPGGDGWRTAIQVRVLHAKVRRALLRRTGRRRAWDTAKLGVPINQEDMAATLLAFSVNAIVGVEFLAGRELSKQEQLDYTALWRYIGWLMGVHTEGETHGNLRALDPCGPGWHASSKKAETGNPIRHSRSMLQSMIFHLLHPDESSVAVSHHLLQIGRPLSQTSASNSDKQLKETKKDAHSGDWWFYFRALQCRRFVGDPLADALRLPLHSNARKRIQLWLASTLYLSIFRVYTLAAMLLRPVRERMRQSHSRRLKSFHNRWQEQHVQRMTEALEERNKENGGNAKPQAKVSCPFAMVAPPEYS